ncbi:aminotransferase class V-fold PLP-dependent enzyme [Pseudomaricurvus sp.]|uniref:aminotransferase class V-fold PLP-dependent enzyme n=1 Tax=Pseudomaricurvus sp. TaxID=2004510 RepID=UPI003F6A8B01
MNDSAHQTAGLQDALHNFSLTSTYLNGAFMHPVPDGAAKAMQHHIETRQGKTHEDSEALTTTQQEATALFAQLISADIDELAWVSGTTAAESLIVAGLGLLDRQTLSQSRVVTDVFHFSGSLFMYNEFAKQGLDLHIVKAHNHRIDLEEIDRALTPGTQLLAVSLVSNVAGFEHDLTSLCALAHAKGVLVYADIIQAAGAMPLNLHETDVDFAACATYKWLMGDYGAGFLYVRRDRQHLLRRTQSGLHQAASIDTHHLPFDTPAQVLLETQSKTGIAGKMGSGNLAHSAIVALRYSLEYLHHLGLENIAQWRQPLLQQLRDTLPQYGFIPMTPPESTSPIISFACENAAEKLKDKLNAADINISLYRHYFRVSPSFYNTQTDIDRLILALTNN